MGIIGICGFLCSVLGLDRQSGCKVLKKVCYNHAETLYCKHANLALESRAKMPAQYLHSAFTFHRPTNYLQELFANVKCSESVDLNALDSDMFCQS